MVLRETKTHAAGCRRQPAMRFPSEEPLPLLRPGLSAYS